MHRVEAAEKYDQNWPRFRDGPVPRSGRGRPWLRRNKYAHGASEMRLTLSVDRSLVRYRRLVQLRELIDWDWWFHNPRGRSTCWKDSTKKRRQWMR